MIEVRHPAMTERAANRTAPLSRADFAFDERIDAIEADVEPDTAPAEAFEAVFDREESVVVELDAGTYRIDAPIAIRGVTSAGIVAKPGADVVFEVPPNYDEPVVSIRDVEHALVAGVDVDQRAPGAHPKIAVGVRESFLIEDLEVRGVGDATGSGSRMPLWVEREGGVGVLRRVRATDGSAFPAHGSGEDRRPATWIGPDSRGTVWFDDCHFEEHNAHAIYAAAAPGPLKVLRGTYRNNDNSQVRLCGPDCEVDGALIELDTQQCSHAAHDAYRATRGIFNEQKKHSRTGGLVRDTTVRIANHPNPVGGYVAYGTGGGMTIEGCEFEIDPDECPAITADVPGERWGHPPAPEPRAIDVLDTRVHGEARSGTAIRIAGRPGSRVERCCVAGRGERCGVAIESGTVRETTFDLGGEAVVDAETVDAIRDGSCAGFFDDRSPGAPDREKRRRRRGRDRERGRNDERDEGRDRNGSGNRGVLASLLERFDLD